MISAVLMPCDYSKVVNRPIADVCPPSPIRDSIERSSKSSTGEKSRGRVEESGSEP
jgi:hypothetical protein